MRVTCLSNAMSVCTCVRVARCACLHMTECVCHHHATQASVVCLHLRPFSGAIRSAQIHVHT